MAITDAVNTSGDRYYAYPELIVYIGDTSGNAPDLPAPAGAPDTFENAHCSTVVRSAGGKRLDFADLQLHLTETHENRTQPADFARMVDVRIPDTAETRFFRGDYVTENVGIEADTETLTASVQLRPYHFGEPVTGYTVWDASASAEATIVDDIYFNPTIDNETVFNRSNKTLTGATALFTRIWTHPETADTAPGETYQDQTRSEWSLQEAVQTMVELLNGSEDFIANPTSYAVLSNTPAIRNVRIQLGERLPDILDRLLIPHGWNWFIDYEPDDKPELSIFKIGEGPEKELFFQSRGQTLDLSESNTNRLEITNSIGDSYNEAQVFGEREEAEVTLPLYAGWPADDDTFTAAELAKDGAEYEGHESAWRLYIANEAGDIDPAVARPGGTPAVPNLGSVFSTATPHRRVLGEPLTYQQGKDDDYTSGVEAGDERHVRRPIVLEYSTDGGTTWQFEEPTWTVKLCPDQIGIYFDGQDIPTELKNAGDNMRLRITGTVFGDARVGGLATKQAHAVNGREYRQVFALPEKFQKRWRQDSGPYRSALIDSGNDADERDDTTQAQSYAEQLRDQNHYAEVDGEYRLPGYHTSYYQIGDLLTKVAGREISLDAAPAGAPDPRYPQIMEIRVEVGDDGPSTVLITDRGTE